MEAAALAAQAASAGWQFSRAHFGPLHVRCVESIRYSVAGADADVEPSDGGAAAAPSDEQGWHQDEWPAPTLTLALALTLSLTLGLSLSLSLSLSQA